MIFVTVGGQLPFNRLLLMTERYISEHSQATDSVFAQIGEDTNNYKGILCQKYLSFERYNQLFMEADLVVGHCGTGTILTALKHNKKLLVVPRRHKFKEHRNDHQVETASRVFKYTNISIVNNYHQFVDAINGPSVLAVEKPDLYVAKTIAEDIEHFCSYL